MATCSIRASRASRAASGARSTSFFRSLAENQGERAIGIVLSGTGTNGSMGLRFIKAEGGIAIAQDPETAAYAGMPQSAIATGVVDLVLPPEKMAEALLDLVRHPYVRQPAEAVEQPESDGQLADAAGRSARADQSRFQPYKQADAAAPDAPPHGPAPDRGPERTISSGCATIRHEVDALARDLTINVSGFFRDPRGLEDPGREGDRAAGARSGPRTRRSGSGSRAARPARRPTRSRC